MGRDEPARQADLFAVPTTVPKITPIKRRILDAAVEIMDDQAPLERVDYMHAALCQVGIPRRAVGARVFERQSGAISLRLEAGSLYRRGQWVEQQLPYGAKPRLVLLHICGEAVRMRSRRVDVGGSMRAFLRTLGIDTSGGAKGGYTAFRKQMEALAACRLSLGQHFNDHDITINTMPISRFDAWSPAADDEQRGWPGYMELSQDFFDSLSDRAVPLDHTAIAALKHSALALDIYTWLAHRLRRVGNPAGTRLSWTNLREQFGQEYADAKNFKREFRAALTQVLVVYPDARVETITGGLLLRESPPPIASRLR